MPSTLATLQHLSAPSVQDAQYSLARCSALAARTADSLNNASTSTHWPFGRLLVSIQDLRQPGTPGMAAACTKQGMTVHLSNQRIPEDA